MTPGANAIMTPIPPSGIEIRKAPKKFEGTCAYCLAEFTYPYTTVTSKPGGNSRRGTVTYN